MGLSKKLGLKGASLCTPNEVEYQWSSQSYTLSEITRKFRLPRVVQSIADSCSVVWNQFRFDLNQPLLLYSKRVVRKVKAKSLKFDQKQNNFVQFGPPIIIPEDYDGWFSVVRTQSEIPPRHTRIEDVAKSPTRRFLVTTQLPALVITPGPNGEAQYVSTDVTPGEVLTKLCICEGDSTVMAHFPSVGKNKTLLRCIDEKRDELLIPFKHRAIMYEVFDKKDKDPQGLVRIWQIAHEGEYRFPAIVRHVYGDPPALAYSFTGTLQLESAFYEETVMASTLKNENIMPLEMKSESRVRFSIALNEADISRTSEYTSAIGACEATAVEYVSQMKVAFVLKPEMPSLEDLNLSMYEAGSDTEDVDAQSEFVIDWDPERTSSIASNELVSIQNDQADQRQQYQSVIPGDDTVCSSNTNAQAKRLTSTENIASHKHYDIENASSKDDGSEIDMDINDLNDSGVSFKEEMV
ncbi:uncharacterized protein LOC121375707 [Gigantopelta aegis]|uniref:uncharacterized protein LOC121375707 n=1 Tax=Gigantopelta aegis TaxID=1735272 RepID=UPI001B889280|nr:uncharacterized protein LOC121375707 [Gigantopelta aegis]